MAYLVTALLALNIFDVLATWFSVGVHYYAVEANPLMSLAISHGFWTFALVKLGAIGLGCALLLRLYQRAHALAIIGAWICVVVYTGVAGWHVYSYYLWRMS